jgi:hypothetical protein
MKDVVRVTRAVNGIHKFTATFSDGSKVHFGRKGYSDYTKHKDRQRMLRYLGRHGGSSSPGARGTRSSRENWTRSGAKTAGFWSRWLLWSSPSLSGAAAKTSKVLGKKIVLK